jgi:hypothetical protein
MNSTLLWKAVLKETLNFLHITLCKGTRIEIQKIIERFKFLYIDRSVNHLPMFDRLGLTPYEENGINPQEIQFARI